VCVADTLQRLRTEASSVDEDASGQSCWVVTNASSPFLIIAASAGWHRLWGFSAEDVAGKTVGILNGPGHDARTAASLARHYELNGSASMRCRNTTRDGAVYSHKIELTRLADGCLAVSRDVMLVHAAGSTAPPSTVAGESSSEMKASDAVASCLEVESEANSTECWTSRAALQGKRPLSPGDVASLGWDRIAGTREQLERAVVCALRQMDATYEWRDGVIVVRSRPSSKASDGSYLGGIPLATLPHLPPDADSHVLPPVDPRVEALLDELLNALQAQVVLSIAVRESREAGHVRVQVRRLHGSPLALRGVYCELSHKLKLTAAEWAPSARLA